MLRAQCKWYGSEEAGFPKGSDTALLWGVGAEGEVSPVQVLTAVKEKVSWQSRAKEYHQFILHNKHHKGDLLGGKKPKKMASSAQVRSNRKLSRREGLFRVSWEE